MDFSPIEEEFSEAVDIRKELNSVHWKDYEALKVVFGTMFGEEPSVLKTISDMNYYKGGYPGPDSPAKLDALMWKVGTIARYFALIDRLEEVNAPLALYGLKIVKEPNFLSDVPMNVKDLDATRKSAKAHDKAIQRFGFTTKSSAKEQVEWFLQQTEALQGVICSMADEIKIRIFGEVEIKLDGQIDKSGFNGAVNQVAKKQLKADEKKDINPVVEKALEKSEILANNGDFLREKITEKD